MTCWYVGVGGAGGGDDQLGGRVRWSPSSRGVVWLGGGGGGWRATGPLFERRGVPVLAWGCAEAQTTDAPAGLAGSPWACLWCRPGALARVFFVGFRSARWWPSDAYLALVQALWINTADDAVISRCRLEASKDLVCLSTSSGASLVSSDSQPTRAHFLSCCRMNLLSPLSCARYVCLHAVAYCLLSHVLFFAQSCLSRTSHSPAVFLSFSL